jgi:hypothetical protein
MDNISLKWTILKINDQHQPKMDNTRPEGPTNKMCGPQQTKTKGEQTEIAQSSTKNEVKTIKTLTCAALRGVHFNRQHNGAQGSLRFILEAMQVEPCGPLGSPSGQRLRACLVSFRPNSIQMLLAKHDL